MRGTVFEVTKNIFQLILAYILRQVSGRYGDPDYCISPLPLLHSLQVKQPLGTPHGFPALLGVLGDLKPL